jgi:large subunit ribosomal protein L10
MKSKNKIPKYKIESVKNLSDLLKNKKTILVASIKNIPNSQFQEIVKKLREKAIVKVPKKRLLFRAIDALEKEDIKKLKEKINESFAILFSDIESYDLANELSQNTSPAKAKPGQEAPEDIKIEEGPTDLVPGPAISELGALGIQIQIEKGKIHIKKEKIIAKKGEKISQGAAEIMGKLDIKPFTIGFIPICAFDSKENKFYSDIKIDKQGSILRLKKAHAEAFGLAIMVNYSSEDTIRLLISKASAHANKINKVILGEPEATVVTEEIHEEKKEEPKIDASAGLASLFG